MIFLWKEKAHILASQFSRGTIHQMTPIGTKPNTLNPDLMKQGCAEGCLTKLYLGRKF